MTDRAVTNSVTNATFTIERRYPASRERVFAAFASTEAKDRWADDPDYVSDGSEREFDFVPVWGIAVTLLYALRRVDCPTCGVNEIDIALANLSSAPATIAHERSSMLPVSSSSFSSKLSSERRLPRVSGSSAATSHSRQGFA